MPVEFFRRAFGELSARILIRAFDDPQDVPLERFSADKRQGQESPQVSEDVLLHYAGRPAFTAFDRLRGDDGVGESEIREGH